MSLPPDIVQGKFEVLHKINEGGMGAVYKVRHLLLDQPFVIKVIRSQLEGDENLRQRFRREAQAASRLRKHPNIAGVHDFSIGSDGTAYIVMEFIDGSTLKEILARDGPPPLALTMEIAHQSLQALAFLHQHGYIHRDVSPDNLMLTHSFDGKPLVKLIDLGLTKRLGASGELTTEGVFLGKVRYSAPEQFKEETLDARSDLYSFGVMLYELLTGRRPIEGDKFTVLAVGHLLHRPLDFDVADSGGRVPEELRRIVLRTLAKDRGRRFSSAEELARALEPFRRPEAIAEDDSRTVFLTHHSRPTESAAPGPPSTPQPSAGGDEALAELDTIVDRDSASNGRRPAIRRWQAGAVAAVAALVAALWWYPGDSESPRPVEMPPARERYELALEAIENEDWPTAGTRLDEAIELDSRESVRPDWGADWDRPYLPHYYRGLVHYQRFSYPLAMREWRESEDQGAIRETAVYQDLLAYRGEVWGEFEDHFEAIRKAFEEASSVAKSLAEALVNPDLESLWKEAPALGESVREALERSEALRRQLDTVAEGQDVDALFDFDEEVSQLKDDLDRLVRDVLAQG